MVSAPASRDNSRRWIRFLLNAGPLCEPSALMASMCAGDPF